MPLNPQVFIDSTGLVKKNQKYIADWFYHKLSTGTLQSKTLAIFYSVVEYGAPVRARSAHTNFVDVELSGVGSGEE